FLFFLFSKGIISKAIALFIFLIASLTDLLDGFLAKRTNQITDFGKLMDPIADKILVLSALLAFVEMGIIAGWMVVAIVFREIVITGLRVLALSKGKVMPSDSGGKHKTVWQIFAIFFILLFIILKEGGSRHFGFWNSSAEVFYRDAIFLVMFVTVVFTLSSGVSYLIKNKEVYSNAPR
ncbi:MAG: CDP-diacylglycerol--glycerol-3-phosphate 3-phosphatidyltransferase, partial [Candidatus Omnitrophota bacterium]|nr:CDP-diacylglycerol--glycerol-3-phosphate 3-phosphatidyltransferase [Candidatus Omnitrophota bacterium]